MTVSRLYYCPSAIAAFVIVELDFFRSHLILPLFDKTHGALGLMWTIAKVFDP
jgi:hypothetical protein